MKTSRQRRGSAFQPEMLETRQVMTAGAGTTFAIMQATVATANQQVTVPFTISSALMTPTKSGRITLGLDVAAQSGSKIVPHVVAIEDMTTHRMVPITHAIYTKSIQRVSTAGGPQTTAVTATFHMPVGQSYSHNYAAIVTGMGGTTGTVLAGFYLPGDADGSGTVDATDVAAIKKLSGTAASSSSYVFADDQNRDGIINAADVKIATQNLGASVKVVPVVSANLSPASDSGIADRITNIQNVVFNGTATPNATIQFRDQNNTAPITNAVADSTGAYSLTIPLAPGDNTFQVVAADAFGQTITGTIAPVTYSLTAPAVATPTSVAAATAGSPLATSTTVTTTPMATATTATTATPTTTTTTTTTSATTTPTTKTS